MKEYTVIIIGSGFGGQCAAINLIKNKQLNFCILERRAFVGGTWSQNTYPGAAVDVQSPLYSIASEPFNWTQMYAGQDELVEYTNHVLKKHSLVEKTVTNANVTGLTWNEEEQKWLVSTQEQGVFKAQFVINATGPLSNPIIPNFEGRDTFKGEQFHSNSWNHSYNYHGKRVAIIGSGASAAQIIPAIAPDVKHLSIFQRTPHWVLPRHDHKFNSVEKKALSYNLIYKALRTAIYWQLETRVIGFKYSKTMLNVFAQQQSLRFIDKQIQNPELRKKVTPDFTIGCKRIILSSTLYPAYCRSNVDLYTKDQGIDKITPTGITTKAGEHIDVDLIVYATGYDAVEGAVSYPIVGKNKLVLSDYWSEYPHAYLGTTVPNFPNLFLVVGPNTGIGHTSAIFIIEAQMQYIMHAINKTVALNKQAIEVSQTAETKYTKKIHSEMEKTVWKQGGCHSWYQSKTGHVIAMYPGFSFSFKLMTQNFKPHHHQFT